MIISVTKEQVPYGIGFLYLAMLALVSGVVMSATSGVALSSDPASRLYTAGFIGGLFLCLAGVLGVCQCAMPKSKWLPKPMNPSSRPWRLRTPQNAGITIGFTFLVLIALPALIFLSGWSRRIDWARVDVATDENSLSKPRLTGGTWVYSFTVEGKFAASFDKKDAPLPAKMQTIWYNPSNIWENHIGRKPPAMNPIIFGFFLLSLCATVGLFRVILGRILMQMRANIEGDAVAALANRNADAN